MPLVLIDRDTPARRPPKAPPIERTDGEVARQRDLDETARRYHPSPELVDAINVALTLGAPLLLTGKPGTGKTQVAFYLKWWLRVDDDHFHVQPIRSTSTADELTYTVDEVRYFHAGHAGRTGDSPIKREAFIDQGPLWKAYDSDQRSIVLVDEIDKAPRDFPNDLLYVLDQRRFRVPELDDRDAEGRLLKAKWHECKPGSPPPILVITSNSERRLPEPFLRRCVFHHIELTDTLRTQAVKAHLATWNHVAADHVDAGITRIKDIEKKRPRQAPSTAEIIMWFTFLDALGRSGQPVSVETLKHEKLRDLPGISALVKDGDDFSRL